MWDALTGKWVGAPTPNDHPYCRCVSCEMSMELEQLRDIKFAIRELEKGTPMPSIDSLTVGVKLDPEQFQQLVREIHDKVGLLVEEEQVAALVECMRTSAQETVEALARRGYAIIRVNDE